MSPPGCSHDLQGGQQGVQVAAAVLLVQDSSARRKGGQQYCSCETATQGEREEPMTPMTGFSAAKRSSEPLQPAPPQLDYIRNQSGESGQSARGPPLTHTLCQTQHFQKLRHIFCNIPIDNKLIRQTQHIVSTHFLVSYI